MLSPVKAIQAYCRTECPHSAEGEGTHRGCYRSRPVAASLCERDACPLWPYRRGRNPSRSGIGGRSTKSLCPGRTESDGA